MASLQKPNYTAFLSHAHADKSAVDRLHYWLKEKAGIPVWYDGLNLPAGTQFGTWLPSAIDKCRTMIVVLSNSAIESGWVEMELNYALNITASRHLPIIPICIEECKAPGFLSNYGRLNAHDGVLGLRAAIELIEALYLNDSNVDIHDAVDIYVSRSWHSAQEVPLADFICKRLARQNFRLIGDMPDQGGWNDQRLRLIMSSCGGFATILPHRPHEATTTSKYMLAEAEIAQGLGLPSLTVAELGVELPNFLDRSALRLPRDPDHAEPAELDSLEARIRDLREDWRTPARPHYIFYAADLDARFLERNRAVERVVQVVTSMPCFLGQNVNRQQGEGIAIQESIAKLIRQSQVTIADLTDSPPPDERSGPAQFSLNVCIEAGIARGAGVPLSLLASGDTRRPPFMLRDKEVKFYQNDADMMGLLHQDLFSRRRRVMNYELES